MENLKKVSVNIWDDFYEDDFIPPGEIQSTHIYIEEDKDYISDDLQKIILSSFLDYIYKNLVVEDVLLNLEHYDSKQIYPESYKIHPELFHISRWQIRVSHLSHKRLGEWMEHFDSHSVLIDDMKLEIYSQS